MKKTFLFFLFVSIVENSVYSMEEESKFDSFEPTYKKIKMVGNTVYMPLDIANYFLALDFTRRSKKDVTGLDISPLKLQKLLYYAQGYYLASFGKPLFEESFLKWENGPVVESVFHQFSHRNSGIYRGQSIGTKQCTFDRASKNLQQVLHEYRQKIDPEEQRYLALIYNMYLYESGETLSERTHNERPWKDTIVQGKIEKSLMADFFRGYPIFDFINALQSFSYEGLVQITNFVRSSLIYSSKNQLEEYQNSLETLKSKVPQKILERANVDYLIFEGQTADQAFLGNFFFPDILEKGFDHSLIYFQHQVIPTLLAFSAHYQNPIAFFYLSKMFREFDYEEAADHFLEVAKLSFTNTLEKQAALSSAIQNKDLMGICHYYISEIFAQQGEYPNSREALSHAVRFLSQSENPEYLVQIAKRITDAETKRDVLLKAYGARDGDAGVLLASLEKVPEGKKRKLHEAFSMGSAQAGHALGGLLLRETPNSPEAISYLKDAIKRGSFGAALTLAKENPSEAEDAYNLASQYGFYSAYYQEYQRLIAQGNNEQAKESLFKAGTLLQDETLLGVFTEEEKEYISDALETYWENLSKIVNFNITPRESITSDSVEEKELFDLIPDQDD